MKLVPSFTQRLPALGIAEGRLTTAEGQFDPETLTQLPAPTPSRLGPHSSGLSKSFPPGMYGWRRCTLLSPPSQMNPAYWQMQYTCYVEPLVVGDYTFMLREDNLHWRHDPSGVMFEYNSTPRYAFTALLQVWEDATNLYALVLGGPNNAGVYGPAAFKLSFSKTTSAFSLTAATGATNHVTPSVSLFRPSFASGFVGWSGITAGASSFISLHQGVQTNSGATQSASTACLAFPTYFEDSGVGFMLIFDHTSTTAGVVHSAVVTADGSGVAKVGTPAVVPVLKGGSAYNHLNGTTITSNTGFGGYTIYGYQTCPFIKKANGKTYAIVYSLRQIAAGQNYNGPSGFLSTMPAAFVRVTVYEITYSGAGISQLTWVSESALDVNIYGVVADKTGDKFYVVTDDYVQLMTFDPITASMVFGQKHTVDSSFAGSFMQLGFDDYNRMYMVRGSSYYFDVFIVDRNQAIGVDVVWPSASLDLAVSDLVTVTVNTPNFDGELKASKVKLYGDGCLFADTGTDSMQITLANGTAQIPVRILRTGSVVINGVLTT